MIKSFNEKSERESEENLVLAYMNALWTAQWFGKKKPVKLEKLLNKKPKTMTTEDMFKEVERLNALFGGKVKYETPKNERGE